MTLWNSVLNWFGFDEPDLSSHYDDDCHINPVSGLPMVGGCGGFDIEGNPYGTDLHQDAFGLSGSSLDDSFSDSMASWNNFTGDPWDD